MQSDDAGEITRLIVSAREGDREARNLLYAALYEEIRRLARRQRHAGRPGDTLQPTALANEAILYLEKYFPVPPRDQPESRGTFLMAAALALRSVLRDYWRKKGNIEHGGRERIVRLGDHDPPDRSAGSFERADFLDLDAALDRLEHRNNRWYQVVMYRYFAWQTIEETAQLVGVSPATVKSDWKLARGWLLTRLEGQKERER